MRTMPTFYEVRQVHGALPIPLFDESNAKVIAQQIAADDASGSVSVWKIEIVNREMDTVETQVWPTAKGA